jgi:hypothetical protein
LELICLKPSREFAEQICVVCKLNRLEIVCKTPSYQGNSIPGVKRWEEVTRHMSVHFPQACASARHRPPALTNFEAALDYSLIVAYFVREMRKWTGSNESEAVQMIPKWRTPFPEINRVGLRQKKKLRPGPWLKVTVQRKIWVIHERFLFVGEQPAALLATKTQDPGQLGWDGAPGQW